MSYACAGMRCPSCGTHNEPNSRFCGGCGARLSAGESRLAPTQKIETGANPVQPRAQQVTPAPVPVAAPVRPATPLPVPVRPATPLPEGLGPAPVSLPGGPMPGAPVPGAPMQGPSSGPVTVQQRPGGPRGQRPSAPQGAAPSPLATPPGAYGAVAPSFETTLGAEPSRIPNSGRGVPVAGAPMGAAPRPARVSGRAGAAHPRGSLGLIVGVLVLDLGLAAAGAWLLSEGLSAGDAPAPLPARSEPPPGATQIAPPPSPPPEPS